MKHIGFTGTRKGMTADQYCSVVEILGQREPGVWFAHHGDCMGADSDFHRIAASLGAHVVGHIPIDNAMRAFCQVTEFAHPKPYAARNADIVRESDVMIACPAESTEQQRGGTWMTIRMARKAGKPLAIVWPDGRVEKERWEGRR